MPEMVCFDHMRKVVVFGTFDILHPGHLYFLEQAKKRGDYLIVVITRDERVVLEKKHQPIFNERERLIMVGTIKWVDKAALGDRAGEWRALKKLRPDVVCVGYDQNVEWIKRCGLKKLPKIVIIKRYKKYGSNKIIDKKKKPCLCSKARPPHQVSRT